MKKKYLAIGAIVFLAITVPIVTLFVIFYPKIGEGQITVINKTSQEVTKGQIEVCGQRLFFEKMKPGDKKLLAYKITNKSEYKVSVKLLSGKELNSQVGYVTRGFDIEDTIILTDENIFLGENTIVN